MDYNLLSVDPPRVNHNAENVRILYFDCHVDSIDNSMGLFSKTSTNTFNEIWLNADSIIK